MGTSEASSQWYDFPRFFFLLKMNHCSVWGVSQLVPFLKTRLFHGSLNVPIEHHPTIRYMVYNGYYKVMSNIPKMGHLPTPAIPSRFEATRVARFLILDIWGALLSLLILTLGVSVLSTGAGRHKSLVSCATREGSAGSARSLAIVAIFAGV